MKIDLQAMLKKAAEADKNDKSKGKLFLSLLGPSGAGKSHAIGTLGEKTLLLYFAGEKHGVSSAKREGSKNIIPICVDYDGDVELSPDEALERLRSIITSNLASEGFKALAIDGLTELDDLINRTKELQKQCLTKTGQVDGFRVPGVVKQMMSGVIRQLVALQATQGLHILTTCIVDVKEFDDNGSIVECVPRLTTYALAESTLQQFADRVVVNPITKSTGEKVHIFDFMSNMTRASKDQNGVVKKVFNAAPRISTGAVPENGVMRADLKELVKIKGA